MMTFGISDPFPPSRAGNTSPECMKVALCGVLESYPDFAETRLRRDRHSAYIPSGHVSVTSGDGSPFSGTLGVSVGLPQAQNIITCSARAATQGDRLLL